MFPQTRPLTDLALVFLRIMLAIVFVNSGWGMMKDPAKHARDPGATRAFVLILGPAEFFDGLALAFGILIQIAAAGLMIINLGAIYMKIAVWRTGFWGEASAGWSYDLLFLVREFVVLTSGGGRYVVWG